MSNSNNGNTIQIVCEDTLPKPYTSYQDSGIEWIGNLPTHWESLRIKCNVILRTEKLDERLNDQIFLGMENVESGTGRILSDIGNDVIDGSVSRFHIGDVLFGKLRPYLAKVVRVSCEGTCSTEFLVLRPAPEIEQNYLFYSLISNGFINWINANTYGTKMPRIGPHQFLAERIPVPPSDEQKDISNFLDRETSRIDDLITKKKRLIQLLQEKRTSLITQTVTKGLDLNVPMQDSGVEWLGEIPAHWTIAPLFSRYNVSLGKMLDEKRITGRYSKPYIRNVDVQWDSINVDNLPVMDFFPHETFRYILKQDDLLVCEGGEVGRTAMWRDELSECYYQKAVHRLRPISDDEISRFFYWVMYVNCKSGRFIAGGNPNTINHLTAVQLRHYRFVFPPKEEQQEIASWLDNKTGKIDEALDQTEMSIQYLYEYRSALITAAVTGKIDVREEAA